MLKESPIWSFVKKLEERLDKLEQKEVKVEEKPVVLIESTVKPESTEVLPDFPKMPVPQDYITIVDLVLNKSFGVRLEPQTDNPSFMLTIVVPKKYSKVAEGEDIRPKVITYADGIAGVRLWVEKVFSNFDQDTQVQIVNDRPFVNRSI